MIPFTLTSTDTDDVYHIRNANICLGPCPSVREEVSYTTTRFRGPMTASGCFTKVQETVWELKPYSGGHYTLHYPHPGEAGGFEGPWCVFHGMRICSRCNSRYLELCSEMPDQPELRKTMARDCSRILDKLYQNATQVTASELQPG